MRKLRFILKKRNLCDKIRAVIKMKIKKQIPIYERERYIGEGKVFSASRKTLEKPCIAHAHDFFEMEFIISGEGTHIINGKEYPIKSGAVYILTPSDVHSVMPSSPMDYFGIMFSEELFKEGLVSENLISTEGTQIYLNQTEAEKMEGLIRLLSEERGEDRFSADFTAGLMRSVMVLFFRAAGKKQAKNMPPTGIKNAVVYIHRHFKEPLTLASAASVANLSEHYFCEVFKNSLGRSFSEYLTDLRLRYAENLLKSSSDTVTEICFASGFNSFSGFFRAFKKHYGISPKEFRKNKGQKT